MRAVLLIKFMKKWGALAYSLVAVIILFDIVIIINNPRNAIIYITVLDTISIIITDTLNNIIINVNVFVFIIIVITNVNMTFIVSLHINNSVLL